ncbi:MAG: OmpA family protein [Rhizobiaceae bacterium]
MHKAILAGASAALVLISVAGLARAEDRSDDFNVTRQRILPPAGPIDPRPSQLLSDDELRQRIQMLRSGADRGMVINGIPAGELMQADRRELRSRQAGGQVQQPAVVQPQPLPEPTQPVQIQPQPLPQAEPLPKPRGQRNAEQPRPKPDPSITDPATGNAMAQLLDDRRPPSRLTDAELRDRIRAGAELVNGGRVSRRDERALRQLVEADTQELNQRIQATTGVDVQKFDANREAERLLSDRRAPARLNEQELRERAQSTRGILALEGLAPRYEEELRRRLRSDRDEIRNRIAAVEQKNERNNRLQVDRNRSDETGLDRRKRVTLEDLNRQPRADDLTLDALGRRIEIVRDQFGRNQLAARERELVEQQIRADRRALRERLFEARRERQRDLSRRDNIIIVDQRARYRPAPTITLAEAYDEDIERQFSAPPARRIDRPYTINEYRANPGLRTLMPGIEVDTVKFGFNEDFLREEEIARLDRIGEVIERVVAGNPREVFLIEGHTDLVGSDAYNEALSLRRAAAIREALTTYFYIEPRNLEIVGYGEQYPRIPTEFEEPENRRVTLRRITPILYGSR